MHTPTNRPSRRRRSLALTLALLGTLAAAIGAVPAQAGASGPHHHDPPAHRYDRGEVTGIDDGARTGVSVLHRSRRGVRAVLRTSGLDPRHAYTVWAVVFNHPEHCDGACDSTDLTNPDVEGVSTWLTGRVAGRGPTVFAGRLRVGDELTNPTGAEIHLIVRTHGPVIRGLRREQITTLNGGCPPNTCANVQMAIHRSARP